MKNANSTWLIGERLGDDLPRILDRPVRFANDANCFALSEATDGAAGAAIVLASSSAPAPAAASSDDRRYWTKPLRGRRSIDLLGSCAHLKFPTT